MLRLLSQFTVGGGGESISPWNVSFPNGNLAPNTGYRVAFAAVSSGKINALNWTEEIKTSMYGKMLDTCLDLHHVLFTPLVCCRSKSVELSSGSEMNQIFSLFTHY